MMYLGLSLIGIIMVLLFVLVGVAFLTMLERKILSYIQNRKGPNKVGVVGIFQPFSDALKLLSKEVLVVFKSNFNIYYMSPLMVILIMLINWMLVPWITNIYSMNYSMLLVFAIMSLGGYMILMSGWSSNSVYSLMGSIRFIAQSISYEVSFILIVFCLMLMGESYSIFILYSWQLYVWNLVLLMPVAVVFFISILAELNRSPMDLIEGESELVSGFNIEYFGGMFALIFLGEYGMIMFMCFFFILMFTNMFISVWFVWGVLLSVLMVILVRGVLPRVRYDELMYVCWKVILPLILNYLLFVFSVKFVLSVIIC